MLDLQTRRLGRTEMKPKELGLGCGYFGYPKGSDDGTIRIIDKGVNFIDMAPE